MIRRDRDLFAFMERVENKLEIENNALPQKKTTFQHFLTKIQTRVSSGSYTVR